MQPSKRILDLARKKISTSQIPELQDFVAGIIEHLDEQYLSEQTNKNTKKTISSKRQNNLKWILAGLIGMILSLVFFELAQASTIELRTTSNTNKTTVLVYIHPTDVNYTVNARIGYSDAKFVSWTMPDYWLQLPVKYYWQDYDWGISRTAGHPGGFSTTTLFGVLELEGENSKVWVEDNSIILGCDNKNVYELETHNRTSRVLEKTR